MNSPVQEGVFRAVFVTFAFITVFLGIVVAGNSEKTIKGFSGYRFLRHFYRLYPCRFGTLGYERFYQALTKTNTYRFMVSQSEVMVCRL